ncbi:MAG: arsenate reductase ArsC, partial [bacterium]
MSTNELRPAAFITRPPERVLFLCIHNSSRSQMAEGFARALAPAGVEVMSAGTEPRHVHPCARQVMSELGLDLEGQTSKSLDQVAWRECDTVVTLCGEADEVCPTLAEHVEPRGLGSGTG